MGSKTKGNSSKNDAASQSEFHPGDKTGMAFRQTSDDGFTALDEAGEEQLSTSKQHKKEAKKKPEFETSTQAEKGFMDKRLNEEH